MANSGLSDTDYYGIDNSDENLGNMDEDLKMIFQTMVAIMNSYHLSNN